MGAVADHVDAILEQWALERPDLDHSPIAVVGRLSAAARLVEVRLRENFARHDLDGAGYDVLATLRRSGPPYRLTPGELMRTAMVTSGAITQRLDRLEARGLVARTAAAGDGRSVHVTLTAAGSRLVDEVLPGHLGTERAILAGLTQPQREALADGLRSLLEHLRDGASDAATGRSRRDS
jgi:DNA-binding MarR family transcriptional regulator